MSRKYNEHKDVIIQICNSHFNMEKFERGCKVCPLAIACKKPYNTNLKERTEVFEDTLAKAYDLYELQILLVREYGLSRFKMVEEYAKGLLSRLETSWEFSSSGMDLVDEYAKLYREILQTS